MGAAGLVEMIVALRALGEKCVPPTVNLGEAGAEACGWVSGRRQGIGSDTLALVTNAGFGGVNTALVLRMGDICCDGIRKGHRVADQQGLRLYRQRTASPVRAGRRKPFLAKREIFVHPFRNFGRLDRISQLTAYAVALALRDAAIEYAPTVKQDIGIIGTSSEGSLKSDIAYFRDYLDNGRTLARGTCSSTPAVEPAGRSSHPFGLVRPAHVCDQTGTAAVRDHDHGRGDGI